MRTDGARIDVEVTSRDLRDDPTVRGVVLTMRDVTEQRKLEQELTHRARPTTRSPDSRTGCCSGTASSAQWPSGPARSWASSLVDLDDFKLVNDTMGHGQETSFLVAVAGRLTATLRPHDPRRGSVGTSSRS